MADVIALKRVAAAQLHVKPFVPPRGKEDQLPGGFREVGVVQLCDPWLELRKECKLPQAVACTERRPHEVVASAVDARQPLPAIRHAARQLQRLAEQAQRGVGPGHQVVVIAVGDESAHHGVALGLVIRLKHVGKDIVLAEHRQVAPWPTDCSPH